MNVAYNLIHTPPSSVVFLRCSSFCFNSRAPCVGSGAAVLPIFELDLDWISEFHRRYTRPILRLFWRTFSSTPERISTVVRPEFRASSYHNTLGLNSLN